MEFLLVLAVLATSTYILYRIREKHIEEINTQKSLINPKQPYTKTNTSSSFLKASTPAFKERPSLSFSERTYLSPSKTTLEAQALYYALKDRGIPVELEKFDGFKTIDIAIPLAKINIEVDGIHHNANSDQALADLKRTYYSYLEGYFTLRIPNSLLRSNLEETTQYIAEMCSKSYEVQLKDR
jgi:very-short-patch-repair endonuclease